MKYLNYLALFCFLVVIVSLFLPVYETWVDESKIAEQTGIGISKIHKCSNEECIAVHNGFGSYYAIFSCSISVLLSIGIFFVPRESVIPIISLVLFIPGLVILGITIKMGETLDKPDQMKIGFYLLLFASFLLLVISFYKSSRIKESEKYVEY